MVNLARAVKHFGGGDKCVCLPVIVLYLDITNILLGSLLYDLIFQTFGHHAAVAMGTSPCQIY